MSRDVEALPLWARLVAYAVLGVGWLASVVFIARYGATRPWFSSEMGRHLMAMSVSVGSFFTLYLVLAVWPTFPLRSALRFVLLIALVATVVWRLIIFEKQDRRDRAELKRDNGNDR
jgi:hypothetical protein